MGGLSGYVRLYRDVIAHPAFRNDAESMAFAWLFAKAAWKPCRVRYKGHGVALARGQLAVSIRDMAEALDRDKAWIERLFKRLKSEGMIETRAETGVSVVTILNYDKYQPLNDERETVGETPAETPGETPARQTQDTEQGREEGKEEKKREPRKRARSPVFHVPDWVPAEQWEAYCAMRSRKKAPVDSYIAERLFSKLETIRAAGWDMAKVIDKATLNNWTDLWMPTPGRDDDLRASSVKPADPAARADLDRKQTALAAIEARWDRGEFDSRADYHRERDRIIGGEKPPPRTSSTGPVRSLAALIPEQLKLASNRA
jgi:hypothetical protein